METINKYIAIITKGDAYIKAGDKFVVRQNELDKVISEGMRVYQGLRGNDGAEAFYPCKIIKETYQLISTEDYNVSNKKEVSVNYYHHHDDNSWQDHWC